jgi:hypothetical protein
MFAFRSILELLYIILILEMYSRYFNPVNNNYIASQLTSYITRLVPDCLIAIIIVRQDIQNKFF